MYYIGSSFSIKSSLKWTERGYRPSLEIEYDDKAHFKNERALFVFETAFSYLLFIKL